MTRDYRAESVGHIRDLLEMAQWQPDSKVSGSVSIIYERIDGLWFLGHSDNDSSPKSKHWKLVIKLGFDSFYLEFVEIQESHEGLVMVTHHNPDNETRNMYPLGNITTNAVDFYSVIQSMVSDFTTYSIKNHNCQHFVREFLDHFQKCFETRTQRLERILQEPPNLITKRAFVASMFSIGSQSSTPSP